MRAGPWASGGRAGRADGAHARAAGATRASRGASSGGATKLTRGSGDYAERGRPERARIRREDPDRRGDRCRGDPRNRFFREPRARSSSGAAQRSSERHVAALLGQRLLSRDQRVHVVLAFEGRHASPRLASSIARPAPWAVCAASCATI